MDDFLTKPLRREALAQVLLRWTSAAPAPQPPVQVPAQPTAAAVDALDQTVLDQLLSLGAAFSSVVQVYLDTAPARLDELAAAVDAGDGEAVGRLAHLLAGSSSCVAAQHVSSACAELELTARTGGVATAEAVTRLRERHEQAAAALDALLAPVEGDAHAHPGR
jgi:HPt (histidine-containing phosphotransfer) domain-containing protein